jgi:hypothetical protein
MYSFKGGAGRTVSTGNVACMLAREFGRRVLLIDLDVESAGASVVFGLDDAVKGGEVWTLQDVFRGFHESVDRGGVDPRKESIEPVRKDFDTVLWPRLHRRMWPRPGDSADGTRSAAPTNTSPFLDVLPAHVVLLSESEQRASSEEGRQRFTHLLRKVETMPGAPEYMLFDSASGQQASAMVGLMNCHIAVIFVRWSRQFIVGTTDFLKRYLCRRDFCSRILKVHVVPTAVPRLRPTGRLGDELQAREKRLRDDIALLNRQALEFGAKPDWIEIAEPIHECEALKWDDRVFLMEERDRAEEPSVNLVLEDYRKLARRLMAK